MPLVINCPVCAQSITRGYHECGCGLYQLHQFAPGQGGLVVLYDRNQIWMWTDEVPVWTLHYERPKPERVKVRRHRRR